MASVAPPGAISPLEPNPPQIRGLVGNRKIGGDGVVAHVRASTVEEEGEKAVVSLGWQAVG